MNVKVRIITSVQNFVDLENQVNAFLATVKDGVISTQYSQVAIGAVINFIMVITYMA